ncbi:MAG: DUF3500 domain-containing protein [Williamsia sp.]|nr:DUF3500 domain-containing protein [Williamsia sp.]
MSYYKSFFSWQLAANSPNRDVSLNSLFDKKNSHGSTSLFSISLFDVRYFRQWILACSSTIVLLTFLLLMQQSVNRQQPETRSAGLAADNPKDAGITKIVRLADALKASLKEDQLARLQLQYSREDAAKWSNLPASFRGAQRVGLNFGAMTSAQVQTAKALMQAVAGTKVNEGWDELQQLLNADDYLNTSGGGPEYGAAHYYIALLGTPAAKGIFEIQFGGHHLAFANTYKDGVLVGATPSFRGVEPFGNFTVNNKTNQPLNQEQAALSAMLTSLSGTELASAQLGRTFSDLMVGPRRDGQFPNTPSGIKCSNLSAAQKQLVLNAIKTYVDDIDDADAKVFLKRYTDELDNTYISCSGTTTVTAQNDYVRIDGPSVWIEYSSQHGIILPGTHPHSVWRDKTKDYGGMEGGQGGTAPRIALVR